MDEQRSGRDFGGQLRDFGRVLREQWWILLLCLVVTAFAAAAYTSTLDKEYEATAKLLLQTDNLGSTLAGTGPAPIDPTRQAATDAQLVALPAVAARVSKKLRQPLSAAAVSTSAGPDANILTVTVADKRPAKAALFANEFARQYIVFRRDTTRERYQRALRTVRTRLAQARKGTPEYLGLQGQIKQLRLLVSLQTGDAQLVQAATRPTSPVRPRPARNIALGVIFGLLLGLALAFLRDRLDRRVKNEDQLDQLFPGVPVIGLVPETGRGRTAQLMTAEGYHTIVANLGLIRREHPLHTLLVTSAQPGEGKSTLALNLALAMRERGDSVLVMDADLRRPSLSEQLDTDRRVGVSTILAGAGTLETSVQEREVEPRRNGDGPSIALAGQVKIVPAGPHATNVQLLLSDSALTRLLESSRERTECVIFDGPPVGSFGDMLPLAKEVDGVIAVVRLYHSRTDELRRFAAQLENAGIKPIGLVVLGAGRRQSSYYASYFRHD